MPLHIPVVTTVDRLTLLAETVLASPASRITLAGLDLSTHRKYKLEGSILNSADAARGFWIYFNGDEVKANYNMTYHSARGGNLPTGSPDWPFFCNVDAGAEMSFALDLMMSPEGRPFYIGHITEWDSPDISISLIGGRSSVISGNLTQIDLVGESGIGEDVCIGAGSNLRLFGYKKE